MAGGGVKVNNINVKGGANGRTAIFSLGEDIGETAGHLYNSFDNGHTWHDLGDVKGEKGDKGDAGASADVEIVRL